MIGGMQGHMNGDAAYHRCTQNCNQGRECDCNNYGKLVDESTAVGTLNKILEERNRAADEIERLRNALEKACEVIEGEYDEPFELGRAALKEK